ncbi:MAG: hypothetical protein BIFFINMI_01470 [Phycisphaerae bacterium]|nr:hypothetical protein [Phycisphaerae bacterium]
MIRKLHAFAVVAALLAAADPPALPAARGDDAAPTQVQRDDFSTYPEGGEPTPAWQTTTPFWEVRGGELVSDDARERGFAVFDRCPPGSDIAVEADVTVGKVIGREWKIAGVAVRADADNYWHLALVEGPDQSGRGHFVELVEMLDGNWLAQNTAPTRLKGTDYAGLNFQWRVGQTYRLALTLSADRVAGRVTDAAGKVVASLAYARDARVKSVASGFAALDNAGLLSQFDNVAVRVNRAVPRPPPPAGRKYPPVDVAGLGGVSGKATGFFHVEPVDGRQWIITPGGRGWLMIGTDHVNYNAHWCEKLGYAPYHRNVEKQFANEAAWAADSADRLKRWGFAALGAGCSDSMRYRGLGHTIFLSFGGGFAGYSDIVPQENWTGLPNVFSPKFRRFCEHRAEERCTPGDPWLVGYFIDNELEWYGKSHREEGVCEEAWKKPADHEAKTALVALLKERHGDIASLNRAWGTAFADWPAALAGMTPPPARSDAARADAAAFLDLVAETYFATAEAAIRKADPNHMILGCRFAGGATDGLWRAAGRHCDIVTVNVYPRADMERLTLPGVEADLRRWHDLCARPLAVTEWSFPALDSGLPCRNGAGMRVDTQSQRALCVAIMQDLLLRQPFVVGSDFFMWADEPAQGISSTFPEDSNYGLVDEHNRPYDRLTRTFAGVNAEAFALHSGQLTQASAIAGLAADASPATQPDEPLPAGAKVTFRKIGAGFEADSGRLRLVKNESDGDAIDRIELDGRPVGRFAPMIWQRTDGNHWVDPDRVDSVADSRLKDGSLVLEVVLSRPGEAAGFRACYRLTLPPGATWFASRLLWIENTGQSAWTLAGYYHSPRMGPGDQPSKAEPVAPAPNYWVPIGAWYDPASSTFLGVTAEPESDIRIIFWKDEGARQHPDAWRDVGVKLEPGQRYGQDEPTVHIFAARGSKNARPWARVIAQARRLRGRPAESSH